MTALRPRLGAIVRARDQIGDKLRALLTIQPGTVTRQTTTVFWRIRGMRGRGPQLLPLPFFSVFCGLFRDA